MHTVQTEQNALTTAESAPTFHGFGPELIPFNLVVLFVEVTLFKKA